MTAENPNFLEKHWLAIALGGLIAIATVALEVLPLQDYGKTPDTVPSTTVVPSP